MMREEIGNHLKQKLIPFWRALHDPEYGGFYGYVDHDLSVHKDAEKGCILMSRITWFFSGAYRLLQDPALLDEARHGYHFLKQHCFDEEYGGVYWSVTCDGTPLDTIKHTYNQAFTIYALASYYDVSGDEEALVRALTLFHLIEEKMKDEGGYLEAFDRMFRPAGNDKLSENGVEAGRTMNTHLHVMEAYTELLRVLSANGDGIASEKDRLLVWKALYGICGIFLKKMWNPGKGRVEVFFDRDWHPLIDLWSSGHDIESSWLCDRAVEILKEAAGTPEEAWAAGDMADAMYAVTSEMARQVYRKAFAKDSVISEFENGLAAPGRIWWVQAEAVVGFLNAWGKAPERSEYREAARKVWAFIKTRFLDPRDGSEWFWDLTEDLEPTDQPIVEPWKCPYHNGRMCFEAARRLA